MSAQSQTGPEPPGRSDVEPLSSLGPVVDKKRPIPAFRKDGATLARSGCPSRATNAISIAKACGGSSGCRPEGCPKLRCQVRRRETSRVPGPGPPGLARVSSAQLGSAELNSSVVDPCILDI